MTGVRFETQPPVVASAPGRTDIACFVGFVRRRAAAPLTEPIARWLEAQGWSSPPYGRPRAAIESLLDVPVPIDSWEVFDRLFDWERRGAGDARDEGDAGDAGAAMTYLGAAIRSFFAQGGRKCYVVRVGDPWPAAETSAARLERVGDLVPGYPRQLTATPVDRRSWRGVGHLFGLPDVSFLCVPDLPDAVRTEPTVIEPPEPPPPASEQFVECSAPGPATAAGGSARLLTAPRCDAEGYAAWGRVVWLIADMIARRKREAHLLAAVPIPDPGTFADAGLSRSFAEDDLLGFLSAAGWLAGRLGESLSGVASAFVQLAYPWVRTPGSARLPEGLEGPDAVLAGVLARNALGRGTFRSAAGLHLADVFDVEPRLRRDQIFDRHVERGAGSGGARPLIERISLLGPTPSGLRLLSDVTTSLDASYRPAAVSRLVGVLVGAARRVGEETVFEASSERVWARLRERIEDLLRGMLDLGALRGASPSEAFQVRCDRDTMSQNDLDSGRVVVNVQFQAAAPVERITVVLALDEGGQISLVSGPVPGREAA